MTVKDAWNNIKSRLNKLAVLDHSYSAADDEAERMISGIINPDLTPGIRKWIYIMTDTEISRKCSEKSDEYKSGYGDALREVLRILNGEQDIL